MAGIGNISTEKMTKNQSNFEVITLSSDEEESVEKNKDVSFLFKRFILACRPHVTKEAIKETRSLFTEVQGKLFGSHELGNMLERYGKQITKGNADLYLNLICNALNEEKSENLNSIPLDSVNVDNDGENPVTDKVAKSVTFCDVSSPRVFKPTTKLSTNQNNKTVLSTNLPDISIISDDDFVSKMPSTMPIERVESMPSTSAAYQDAKPDKANGKISIKTLNKKQKKKLAARLKQRLKEISNKIKILDRAELTLEEMDMCDSTYIQENRLKKKFESTWNKLCKVLGRPPNTGRVVEKPIRASSTGYSMIDKAVAKFLNAHPGSFPDYFDIRDIVLKTNHEHDLRMSPQVLNGLIADIFTDIGNKLQKRREKDLLFNFGSHLLDDFRAEEDPALANEKLARELEKNRRISKRNLKQVYSKYAHLERSGIDDRSRNYVSTKDNKDSHSEFDTSDDEQESTNHEIRGKSRKSKGSPSVRPGRGVDMDVSSESSTSEDDQDLSRTTNEDSIVVVDSDMPSSQEYSVVTSIHEPSTDMTSSTSNAGRPLADTDLVECPASPTFPLSCPIKKDEAETSELATLDPVCLNNETSTHKQVSSSSSDCKIINDPNELGQLSTPANEPLDSQKQPNTDFEFKTVYGPNKQRQLDEPANKSSVFEIQPNNDECEIVIDQQEESVSVKQLDDPANKPSVCEPHLTSDDDCLIIEDDQETLPTTSSSEEPPNTATHNDELTLTLNALQEVFQTKGKIVDKSKSLTLCSNDHTEPGNSDGEIVAERVCSSEARTSIDCKKDWGKPKNSDPTLVSDDDIVMSDFEQFSTSHNRKDSESIFTYRPPSHVTDKTAQRVCTTTNSSPKHHEAESNNQSSQSSSAKEPDDAVNPRKRKATSELAVRIPKSSVKCLEQIAIALKNKRLKIPDAWVNSGKVHNDSSDSLSKPTTSKESPSASNDASSSKHPTTPKVDLRANENPPLLVNGKAKIDLQHRKVFREKTLNALKVPVNVGCNIDNSSSDKTVPHTLPTSDIVDEDEQCEVIVIDD